MKISKRQLKRIIREEKNRLLTEGFEPDSQRFQDIMTELADLVEEAFEIAGRPEAARGYWYNGILSKIDPSQHGMASRSYSMADTLEEIQDPDNAAANEDLMEKGYNDGHSGEAPSHPDNEYYMVNYNDGQNDRR